MASKFEEDKDRVLNSIWKRMPGPVRLGFILFGSIAAVLILLDTFSKIDLFRVNLEPRVVTEKVVKNEIHFSVVNSPQGISGVINDIRLVTLDSVLFTSIILDRTEIPKIVLPASSQKEIYVNLGDPRSYIFTNQVIKLDSNDNAPFVMKFLGEQNLAYSVFYFVVNFLDNSGYMHQIVSDAFYKASKSKAVAGEVEKIEIIRDKRTYINSMEELNKFKKANIK